MTKPILHIVPNIQKLSSMAFHCPTLRDMMFIALQAVQKALKV